MKLCSQKTIYQKNNVTNFVPVMYNFYHYRTIVRGTTVFHDGKIILQKPPGRKLLSGELGEEVGRFGEVVPGGPQISRRMSLNPAMVTTAFAPGEKDPRLTRRQSYYK